MTDRTVHAQGHLLGFPVQVVRYNRAGKWYLEYATGSRRRWHITCQDAIQIAQKLEEVFIGFPGGRYFDRHFPTL